MRAVRTGAAVVATLLLVACGREPAGAPAAAAGSSDATSASQAQAAPAQGGDTLRLRAERAMREGRMYAPAGDSAIEHWLAARGQAPGDATLQTAIIEMQPYLLIACEQAIGAGEFDEARRLLGLMTRSTPDAPALPRLLAAIGSAEQAQQLAQEAQGEEQAAARLAAEDARRQASAAVADAREQAASAAAADAETEAEAAAQRTAAAPPQAVAPAPRQDAAAPGPGNDAMTGSAAATDPASASRVSSTATDAAGSAPAASAASAPAPINPAPPAAAAPRMLSGRAPRYPMIAMNRRIEGSVQVAFTVNGDGSVGNARVVEAQPSGVFDRAAVEAVEDYRFEPSGRSQDSRVTINFTLPDRRG